MYSLVRNQMFLVYVLLVLATLFVWGMAEGGAELGTATVVVVVIAAIKQAAVVLYFMELRNAPAFWRLLFGVVIVLPAAGILWCYWVGGA